MLRKVRAERIQCDEIWCFAYTKDKNVPDGMRGQPRVGSIWTWTAMDADSKRIVSWQLGARDAANAHRFIGSAVSRLAGRVQLTTDGMEAVDTHFGGQIEYVMLVKVYGVENEAPQTRYSPAKCLGAKNRIVAGEPDRDSISTRYVERQNLNIRMGNRRSIRLTNAFSRKAEMFALSVAISFMCHNFVRIH